MPLFLKKSAKEGSSYIVNIVIKDEEGNLVTPNNLYWTLTDFAGNIVNNRKDVKITSLSSSVNIPLTGNDLPAKNIVFTVKGKYDSTYGNDLDLQDSIAITVNNLIYDG